MGKKLLVAFFMTAIAPSQADSQESAVPLPELTVEVSRDWCPVSDDPAAHEALESAAVGIPDPSSYEGLSVQTQGVVRSVRVNEVGRTPVPPQTIRSRFSMKSAI